MSDVIDMRTRQKRPVRARVIPILESFRAMREETTPEKAQASFRLRQSLALSIWLEESCAAAGIDWTLKSLEDASDNIRRAMGTAP